MQTIMIVDDSLIVRIGLRKLFEKQGYQVVAEAANGVEAVEKYIRHRPDLVTMDITMPVLDGISALQQICVADSRACVVMISALGQELRILEALNKGAKHFIVKPFKEDDVLAKVGRLLSQRETETAHV